MAKKKKSKKGKKKKGDEYLPLVYNIPDYEDPNEGFSEVKLKITLAIPDTSLLCLNLECLTNQKVSYLVKQIQQMHQGAVSNILISRDRNDFSPNAVLDQNKTLEELKIFGDYEFNLYYDYLPVVNPLLK